MGRRTSPATARAVRLPEGGMPGLPPLGGLARAAGFLYGIEPVDLLTAAVALLILMDPLGNIPIFLSVTGGMDAQARNRTLTLSVAVATAILAFFALGGVSIFSYFGVEMGDFVMASGVILTVFSAYYLVRPWQGVEVRGPEAAVVPLAVPLLAGPASITYTILIAHDLGAGPALAAVAAASAATYVTLRFSLAIERALGRLGISVMEKVMLIVSVAIGMSLIRRGLREWGIY